MTPTRTRYLSNRPFLVIDILYRPAKGVRTERRGWAKEPRNWDTVEVPRVVDRISPSIMRDATLIIDVMLDKIVKNRFSETEAADVLAHFRRKYADRIAQADSIWTARETVRRSAMAT